MSAEATLWRVLGNWLPPLFVLGLVLLLGGLVAMQIAGVAESRWLRKAGRRVAGYGATLALGTVLIYLTVPYLGRAIDGALSGLSGA